eukprot:TRINITY_DN3294_c1_g2_i1.p1 TRINITY_DN3294_c1_g2~~TRINITY_DN3294_c1_g2_i1.p1  ORF type:complete len:183 (-),score=31.28 TRINITY_DN3294_c1_g2_i1:23-571(-)
MSALKLRESQEGEVEELPDELPILRHVLRNNAGFSASQGITTATISATFKRIAEKMGIPELENVSGKSGRVTYITMQRHIFGLSDKEIMRDTGQLDPRTLEYYDQSQEVTSRKSSSKHILDLGNFMANDSRSTVSEKENISKDVANSQRIMKRAAGNAGADSSSDCLDVDEDIKSDFRLHLQ